jgi:sterol desaturase/sphingolipid hydroxylase (fatty acid hydroxylase superfamily)
MSARTGEAADVGEPFEASWHWRVGAVSGFAATVVMGVGITIGDLRVLQGGIAGLYAFEGSLVAGWVAHLLHGTLFGVLFAVVLSDPSLYRVSEWAWKTVLAGVVYGLVLALAGAGFVMPVWLGLVGFGSPPPVPNISAPLVGWHVIYGIVLGGAYAVLDHRWGR